MHNQQTVMHGTSSPAAECKAMRTVHRSDNGSCWFHAACGSPTLWFCAPRAQGRKATSRQAATTTGVHTRAKRVINVSARDCC